MNKKKEVLQEKIINQTWLPEKMDINRFTISKMKIENLELQVITQFGFQFFWAMNLRQYKYEEFKFIIKLKN